jgi:hypothetical protein
VGKQRNNRNFRIIGQGSRKMLCLTYKNFEKLLNLSGVLLGGESPLPKNGHL